MGSFINAGGSGGTNVQIQIINPLDNKLASSTSSTFLVVIVASTDLDGIVNSDRSTHIELCLSYSRGSLAGCGFEQDPGCRFYQSP